MELSEKLYTLRRKKGLSQEQLAQSLGVSRQAISKWESGQSLPESSTLVVISEYFNVSLDYLLKSKESLEPKVQNTNDVKIEKSKDKSKTLLGVVLSVLGSACLIIWGLISILNHEAANRLSDSSTIHIDGNGIFLFFCVVAIIAGAILILKSVKNNQGDLK